MPDTKCRIINSQMIDKNNGNITPQTINTGHAFPISATYLCNHHLRRFTEQVTQLSDSTKRIKDRADLMAQIPQHMIDRTVRMAILYLVDLAPKLIMLKVQSKSRR